MSNEQMSNGNPIMTITKASEIKTEIDELIDFMADDKKNTQRTYLTNYKKIRKAAGKDLREVPLEDIVLIIGALTQSYETQRVYLTTWGKVNYSMPGLEYPKPYRNYIAELRLKCTQQLKIKNKERQVSDITLDEINQHMSDMYDAGDYQKYIINYLLLKLFCRNKDLDLQIVRKKSDVSFNDTNYLLLQKSPKQIVITRNVYKTSDRHGTLVSTFRKVDDPKFYQAVVDFATENTHLLGDTDGEYNSINPVIYRALPKGACESMYLRAKLKQVYEGGDINDLLKISKLRGSSTAMLLSSYNQSFQEEE
tara:strand:+ start:2739 stop:3665 length:927 start_codon:yes stop_codon:yes gene_type:complete